MGSGEGSARQEARRDRSSTLRRNEVRAARWQEAVEAEGHRSSARQGSSRAPHFVGGGKVFTPKPRDYEYQVPGKKAMAGGAAWSALSLKAKESKLVILDGFGSSTPSRPSAWPRCSRSWAPRSR